MATRAALPGVERTQRLNEEGKARKARTDLYGSMQVVELPGFLQKAFEQAYGVKIKLWRGAGADILQRAVSEAQANRADVDAFETDGFALEKLHREALLAPVKSPYHADLVPEAVRPHGEWVGTRVNISAGAYNTGLVKPANLPKNYDDLLQARFKGQLGIEADESDWFGMTVGLLGEDKGLALFRNLVATNGISVRKGGPRFSTNLVAAGEVPIALNVYMQNVDVAKKGGAPVDWFLISPAVARFNGVAVAKRAPPPARGAVCSTISRPAARASASVDSSSANSCRHRGKSTPYSIGSRSIHADPGVVIDQGE